MSIFETKKVQNDTIIIILCSFLIIIDVFILKINICDKMILCVSFKFNKGDLKMDVIRKVINVNLTVMTTLTLFLLGLFFIPSVSLSHNSPELQQCLADLEYQEDLTLRVRREKAKAFNKINKLNGKIDNFKDILSKVDGGCVLEAGDDGKLNVDHDSLSSEGSQYSSSIASVSLKCVDANLLFTNLNDNQNCVDINTSDSESYYDEKRYVSIKTVTLTNGSVHYFLRGSTEELRLLSTDSGSSYAKEAVFRRGPGRLLSIDPDTGGEVSGLFATACDHNPSDPFCMGYYGIVSVSSNSTGVAYNYVSGTDVRIINGEEVHSMLAQIDRTAGTIELSDRIYEKSDELTDTTSDLYTDNASYIPMFEELKSRLPDIVSGEITEKDWSFCE